MILKLLEKIDFRTSGRAFSRPEKQVELLVKKILHLNNHTPFDTLLDIGGGFESKHKGFLSLISNKYLNLEIKQGRDVDIVGSAYKIPLKSASIDVTALFMILEHLNNPLQALQECCRVLKRRGYLILTTVQYWHTHGHPSDYFRYTKFGLEYLCREAGFEIFDIWSIGGPFLVVFHAIELNLPRVWRTIFSIFFYRLFDWLDWVVFKHEDTRKHSDSVGWALIAKKV